jgi:hypothetical protein
MHEEEGRYPEETDSGYIASASHPEELELPQRKAEPNPKSEKQIHGHDRPGKQHQPPYQTESSSLGGDTNIHRDGQLSRQKSHEEFEASLQSNSDHNKGVQYSQEHACPQDNEENSFSKSATSLPAKCHPNDPPEGENDRDSNLNASDSFGKCQRCRIRTRINCAELDTDSLTAISTTNIPKLPHKLQLGTQSWYRYQ